ncbi:hypothetical protein [Clostridium sp. UBA4548]|uniref:hypothetical protein n=1 Tax=Clostridium sp. UBA4548 TaxID=1946361 RepID=UPI0025BEF704|nr:hypothetical protein [Clostridium sp. UBA4548]
MEEKIIKLEKEIKSLKDQVKSLVDVVNQLKPQELKEKYINLRPDLEAEQQYKSLIRCTNL